MEARSISAEASDLLLDAIDADKRAQMCREAGHTARAEMYAERASALRERAKRV